MVHDDQTHVRVCACVCVCARAHVCVCVCVQYATRDRAAHFLEELQSLADRRSRTNRVTAAPLELHATLDARKCACVCVCVCVCVRVRTQPCTVCVASGAFSSSQWLSPTAASSGRWKLSTWEYAIDHEASFSSFEAVYVC